LERLGTVAIVGVGLIGGSIGLALRARSLAERVIGIGRDQARLVEGVRRGAIDDATTDLAAGVSRADVVVICTPVTRIAGDVAKAAKAGPDDMLITDAGSTKRMIVEEVEQDARARAVFVGGHPIAGSERKGVEHADADLFEGRACVLTPTPKTPVDRLNRARTFWRGVGCRLIETDPTEHDEALALTSHLPHAVASALASTVPIEALGMAAGAYRDGTRVAGSDAELWSGIFKANRAPLLAALRAFQGRLHTLESALATNDDDAIQTWWEVGRARRTVYDSQRVTRDRQTENDGQFR
jgi:prephenate dehydrogenase